ncbi:methyl-accepting chemotaxis protein [Paenibacillus sp. N3/727]|uniref:methyl-accepting chemotaxis protein n=1 Tax=Paenibacillus sp. N3/727 TaxID=2925845 RepID=UPI001F52DBE4|nr:HAMP domain-containing methyl-accepting chemotaxis protein [Paenibacillus sp. N3/727]UNK16273.1 methyl-accepting chemotaxis protein [Paenibacillus sp. N3/727]
MRILRNLKVRTKLFLLIGFFTVSMVTLSVIGFLSMTSMAKNADAIYFNHMIPQANFIKYRANNRAMETIVFQLMQDTSRQETEKFNAKFEELLTENLKYLDMFLESGMSQEEKKIVTDIKAGYPAYIESMRQVIALGGQNRNDEAYDYYKSVVEQAYNVIYPLGVQLENDLMNSADAINRSNTEHAEQSIQLTFFISIVMIAICCGLGILIIRMIVKPIQSVQKLMKEAERGDFTGQVNYRSKDELGQLTDSLNSMLHILRGLFGQIAETSQQVAAFSLELTANAEQTSLASEHIASNVQGVASGADRQVQVVEQTAETLIHMGNGIQHIARNAQVVSETAIQASDKSLEGNQAITTVVHQMNSIHGAINELDLVIHGLKQRSEEIGAIVGAITEIAEQTNLLALNAAIEAARAGEHGQGFAVVANHVRKLSEQSAISANKISVLITTIQSETEKAVHSMERATTEVFSGMDTVNSAGQSFEQIQQSVNEVVSQIQEVSSEVQNLASGTDHMLRSVEHINEAAQTSAVGTQNILAATEEQLASMEEISASSSSLSQMAEDLQDKVNQFKIYG